jgi:hypothetical protein
LLNAFTESSRKCLVELRGIQARGFIGGRKEDYIWTANRFPILGTTGYFLRTDFDNVKVTHLKVV